MPERIPQSTVVRIPLYAVLNTDHLTPATGKTIAVTISKNGAAFGNPSVGATNATEIGQGWYYYDTSTTDTGTLGPLIVRGAVSTIDDATIAYRVVSATNGGFTALPDALPGATNGLFIAGTNAATTVTTSFTTTFTGNLTGSVGSVTGAVGSVTGSVGSIASGGIAAASFANGAITAAAIADAAIDAATFATGALDAVWSTASRTLTAWSFQLPANGLANVTAWTVNITGNITGNLTGSVGSVAGNVVGSVGSVVGFNPADVTDIKAQTDLLTFSGDGVDSNVASVNEVTVTGTGVVGDTWGP